jgi:hypothetical protein
MTASLGELYRVIYRIRVNAYAMQRSTGSLLTVGEGGMEIGGRFSATAVEASSEADRYLGSSMTTSVLSISLQ